MAARSNVVLCSAWVPKGKAEANPVKVVIPPDELKDIINETGGKLDSLSISKDDEDEDWSDVDDTKENIEEDDMDVESEEKITKEEEEEKDEDFDKMYSMDKYDEEPDSHIGKVSALGGLIVYPDPKDDPLVTQPPKDEDELSEAENHAILPDDNLIAVGHFEQDASILEVYVYNEKSNSLYVHHDNLLPEAPLCMEWINYQFSDKAGDGNNLAVGVMGSVIQIWDLDLIDGLKPVKELHCELVPRVKAKVKRIAKQIKNGGIIKDEHYGVLALAVNKEYSHILASGDTEGVILWDLGDETNWTEVQGFSGRVQCLKWHPTDPKLLLAGTSGGKTGGKIHLVDCTDKDHLSDASKGKVWSVKGDVEQIQWASPGTDNKLYIIASTGLTIHKKKGLKEGYIYCWDTSKPEPLWTFQPHDSTVSALVLSAKCPGLMVTGADDETLRVWDTFPKTGKNQFAEPPTLVEELNPRVGQIFTLTESPEQPFVFCMGGNNKCNNFRLWDITTSQRVRQVFCPRLNMPVDEKKGNTVKLEVEAPDNEEDDILGLEGGSKGEKSQSSKNTANQSQNQDKKKKKKRKVKRLADN